MLLSICIPTHDGRGWCLRETIDSVLAQVDGHYEGQVEICVSDNGSRDDTAALLAGYAAAHPKIFVLHRFETNQGGHNNFLKVVEIASGDYCWLLGSDDWLRPNAVSTILRELRAGKHLTGITVSWSVLNGETGQVTENEPALGPLRSSDHELLEGESVIFRELFLRFTFMSGHVFSRSAWLDVVAAEGKLKVFSYRHFMHLYILGKIVQAAPRWLWMNDRLVLRRGGNESLVQELGNDQVRHYLETHADLDHCWGDIAGRNNSVYRSLMSRLYTLKHPALMNWRDSGGLSDRDAVRIVKLVAPTCWHAPRFTFYGAPYLLSLGHLRRLSMKLAPRTRLRRVLSLLSIENGWTSRYDAQVQSRRSPAAEHHEIQSTPRDREEDGRYAEGNAASDKIAIAMPTDASSTSAPDQLAASISRAE